MHKYRILCGQYQWVSASERQNEYFAIPSLQLLFSTTKTYDAPPPPNDDDDDDDDVTLVALFTSRQSHCPLAFLGHGHVLFVYLFPPKERNRLIAQSRPQVTPTPTSCMPRVLTPALGVHGDGSFQRARIKAINIDLRPFAGSTRRHLSHSDAHRVSGDAVIDRLPTGVVFRAPRRVASLPRASARVAAALATPVNSN